MDTFLFDKVVFGPVKSRRLGTSLGINLLPVERKYCNFDCVYCECGLNIDGEGVKVKLPSRTEVSEQLREVLIRMSEKKENLDVITFAGNGEPTMHPDFQSIIDDTIELRNNYFNSASISVLSNSTLLHKKQVIDALNKVDHNILKLDSAIQETIQLINRPVGTFSLSKIVGQLKSFSGNVIIQTMFVRGVINGQQIDNTTPMELSAWEALICEIKPKKVMIYTVDRNTPFDDLEKVPLSELQLIGKNILKHGISVQVSG